MFIAKYTGFKVKLPSSENVYGLLKKSWYKFKCDLSASKKGTLMMERNF